MTPHNRAELLALVARVVLGAWFVYSGGLKLWGSGLDQFTRDIANYKLVAAPWDAVAAYSVPWLELVAGLCLMLGFLHRGAVLVVAGLVVGFCFFVAWAWWHELDISCGCRGDGTPMVYWVKAGEFVVYFATLAWIWVVDGRGMKRQKMQNMA